MGPIHQSTRRINDETVCLAVLFFYVLPRHTNIMADKAFNVLDECADRCVHLFPQEEKSTSSSWGDSEIYTSGSIADSQRILIEIKKNGTIAKTRTWVSQWYCQTLKAFRIISSKMKISFLIQSWWCFNCLQYSENRYIQFEK